jgi:ORF6N domain
MDTRQALPNSSSAAKSIVTDAAEAAETAEAAEVTRAAKASEANEISEMVEVAKATAPMALTTLIPDIATRIVFVRGQKVILDFDLATLYGVETRRLNEQVRRNIARFPADFMFELTRAEYQSLMSQFATSNSRRDGSASGGGRGGRRKVPLAFTEHGALMAASVLHSTRATQVSIVVVRAFVQLRDLLSSNKELEQRFQTLADTVAAHDEAITSLIDTLRDLLKSPEPHRRPIGFVVPTEP